MAALVEPPELNLEDKDQIMKKLQLTQSRAFSAMLTATCALLISSATCLFAGKATVVSSAIWAHGHLYGTAATDTAFKSPPEGTTDVLFNFGDSGLEGQRSVSEAAPRDWDYNGGRWNVMLATYTPAGLAFFDNDNDGKVDFELTKAEDILGAAEMGLITITKANVYFVCPLRPE